MNQELGFETIPFEIAPEFQGEVFEEESERGGSGRLRDRGPASVPLTRPDTVQGAPERFRQLARRSRRYESPDQAAFGGEGRGGYLTVS